MIRQAALFAAVFLVSAGAFAQDSHPRPARAINPLHVVENSARAVIDADAMRVTLPLSAPAASGTAMTAWLLSTGGLKGPETTVAVKEGTVEATLLLAWKSLAAGTSATDAAWLRIAYRVDVQGVVRAHGVIAAGAITTNFMVLRAAYPKSIRQGQSVSARVIAVNPVTEQPLAGVQIKAELSDTEDKKHTLSSRCERVTGKNGEAVLNFAPIGEPGDDLALEVSGVLSGTKAERVEDKLTLDLSVPDFTQIRVETDKPLHKPGETVHLRALVFGSDGKVLANRALTLEIRDPEDKKLLETELTTNKFGIAAYDWKTSEQADTGDYDAKFEDTDSTSYASSSSQTIRIQRYDLPEFTVAATPGQSYYLPGDATRVKIHAGYLFGKPVAAGAVRIVRANDSTWNSKTGKYETAHAPEKTGTLSANGDAEIALDLTADFADLKESTWERYKDIGFRALVTDASTGRTEPRNFSLRITREPVHIYLNAIGNDDREGEYLLSTSFADGAPAPCKVTLDWMDGDSHPTRAMNVTTNRYGLAKITLHFPPPAKADQNSQLQVRITARDEKGRTSHFDDSWWAGEEGRVWISLHKTLLRPGQPIEGTLHGQPGEQVDLDVLSGTQVLQRWQLRLNGSEQEFSIPSRQSFHGEVTLRAIVMRGSHARERWYGGDIGSVRTVLFPEDLSLHASVRGLQPAYLPGAAVHAELALRNAAGGAVAGAFGVSVFDQAVEERANTELEANDRWFGGGGWWLRGSSAGGITREDLDKVDVTKPVPEDLDLAAEADLRYTGFDVFKVEANDDSAARDQLQKQMQRQVQPLGAVILAALPPELPATMEEVAGYADRARLDAGILSDAWNTPFRLHTAKKWFAEALDLESAGPDKQFGTQDDFALQLLERNIFAVPGEKMNRILASAAAAGRALPQSPAELRRLMHEGGLELDSAQAHTLQADGKPYNYAFNVVRRHYFVQVLVGNLSVWETQGIDYFGPVDRRLAEALKKWTEQGNAFPESEESARRAFAAGGVDFDSLRDPLGHAFALTVGREQSYARIDKISAAAEQKGGTGKVTLISQVVHVLRTDEKGVSYGNSDEVARFAHTIAQQSGGDLTAVPIDGGLFAGNTGAIAGTITDPTGAVIPGARIQVENLDDHTTASATAGRDGGYILPGLSAGYYKVRVDASGFMVYALTDVHVASSALTKVDVTLRLATATETVTVEADALAVNADSSTVASLSQGVLGPGKKLIVASAAGRAEITEQTATPRLRSVFAETAYWSPSLETAANGRAAMHFTLPDSLTTWKLHALGSTVDGRVTAVDSTFQTFQPFFIDLDAPQVLTAGDEMDLPVNLRNYTAHALSLPVTVAPAGWFALQTPATQHATVAANSTTPVIVGLTALQAVDAGPLRITAAAAREGDAIEKKVKVHPDGEPRVVTASELLRGREKRRVELVLPDNAILGSTHAELLVYPNLGANVYHAMKAVLERPYGCAEQTTSAAYTSLLFLELPEAAHQDEAARAQAKAFLQLGYDRLLGYFSADGGVTYWGGSDAHADAAVTAYAVEFLIEAAPHIQVDPARVESAARWLLAHQAVDGYWPPRYGRPSAREALFIASALAQVLNASMAKQFAEADFAARVRQAVSKAQAYAASSVLAMHDPYAQALQLTLATQAHNGGAAAKAAAELRNLAQHGHDGASWEIDGFSPFYGWGASGRLEATALALAALNAAGNATDAKLEDDALLYLLRKRDGYGVWMSGQATVRVLKALLPLAIAQLAGPTQSGFALTVNGRALTPEQAAALKADARLVDAPRSLDLSAMLHPGINTLEFESDADAAFANAQLTAKFYVPWKSDAAGKTEVTAPGASFGLDFAYKCDAGGAKAGQPVQCTVHARRFGAEGYGMMLAEVGLPPGADVDRASLGTLLSNWTISRYELQPDRIIFYLWSPSAEGTEFSFRFTPRYAMHAKAAPARLSDYYNPELGAVLAPQTFTVQKQ